MRRATWNVSRDAARSAALLVAAMTASCAWSRDRGADLADLFVVEGSLGLGASVDVKATDLLHVGVGYAHARKAGLRGRQAEWLRDREVGLPASLLLVAGALRDGRPWRLGDWHTNSGELWHGHSPWRAADLELGVFAGFLGLRLGFSPGELVDLLAGLVGLDPAGDDLSPEFQPAPGEPVEPGVWLVGDLHDHCDPPDGGHAPVSPAETHALAQANGLDFVGINPHLWLRGAPPAERPELRELAAQVRALEGRGPIVIPGLEVMLHRRRGAPLGSLGPQGHVLLLFRDLDEAYAFDGPFADERDWVRERLATLPRERRLWVPSHPWPHPRIEIPFLPDHAADWKQLDELPQGEVALAGRGYARWATPWLDERREDGDPTWRLVRYRLEAVAREELPVAPATAALETIPLRGLTERGLTERLVRLAGEAWSAPALQAELGQAAAALHEALGRELGPAPAERRELELAVDVGRNAWLWVRVAQGPLMSDREAALELGLGATTAGRDGGPPPLALHDVPIDGLEALSGLVHLASLAVGRRGDELDVPHVFARLERRMLAEGRRLVPLAGSDNHRDLVFPTLRVFARERSRAAIFDALREGRVVVGGPDAASLRVRTDLDPVWRAVGASVRAERKVELRWDGAAELFVDGRSLGRQRGGYTHEVAPGALHVYRIVRGSSWSGWVYVNLPR